jgi:methane monooxygenase component A beta chain/propane monooxygenase small subunit
LRSGDWWAFRDPSKTWQRPYVTLQAEQGKSLERLLTAAKARGVLADFDARWCDPILSRHYATCAFFEYGLFRAFSYAQREALADVIGNVCIFNAADKIRYAQEISLYGMELAQSLPGFTDVDAKQTWLTDPVWQGVRENIEKLMVLRDWGEIITAANLVFEPLVGELVRVEFFLRSAPRQGDSVTPAIIESAELDWERNRKWTQAFAHLVLTDPTHAAANRRLMQSWIDSWTPLTLKAAHALAPLFELPPVKPHSFAAALARVQQAHATWLTELELTVAS